MGSRTILGCFALLALSALPASAAADEPPGFIAALIQRLSVVAERVVATAPSDDADASATPIELEHAREAAGDLELPSPTEPSLRPADLEEVPRALYSLVGRGLDVREHANRDHGMSLQIRPRNNGARVHLSFSF